LKIRALDAYKYASLSVLAFASISVATCAEARNSNAEVTVDAGSAVDASSPVSATTAASGAPEGGDIVVTARKSNESILKTPIAIKAFTSADLAARGVVSLQDIAQFSPGLKIIDNAAGRNDRSFQQIIIRGFTPSTGLSQTTSMFIDGVPVASATAISNITDPQRVEILKGPQSAYFGRQTFAGAFNVVTKDPTDRLTASIQALVGTRSNYDVGASISGPLISDILEFRVTGRAYGKDGSYHNAGVPNQTLGDQSTRTGSLALLFRPSANFTAKAYGMISTDRDGAPAQGLISAYTLKNPAGGVVVQGQSNCNLAGVSATGVAVTNPYICGVTPKLINSPSANATNDSFTTNYLSSPNGRTINPQSGATGYGLRSRFYHVHLAMDWRIPDSNVTLTSLTGYNNERYSQFSDLDNYYDTSSPNTAVAIAAGGRSYFDYPYLVERTNKDFSQEVRATFDNKGPFRLTVGGSYLNNHVDYSLGGGNGGLGTTYFATAQGRTRSKTEGAFFGLGYDITSRLTLNVDGRYQVDHLYAYAAPAGVTLTSNVFAPAGFYTGGTLLKEGTYKNFMPRTILKFDVTPKTMVYASFSQGINPGAFNTSFLTGSPAIARTAAALGYTIETKPEHLDNYEIGMKGRLFDNHLRYALSAYYGIWTDQLNQQNILGTDPATGQPLNLTVTTNTGKVRMSGVEGEMTAFLTPELTLDMSGAYNNSYILNFAQATLTQLTGISNFRGKQNPGTPRFSATASLQYVQPIPGHEQLKGFVRTDYSFKSGVYSDAANIVRTPAQNLVNLRIGLKDENASIEAFVTNVFNNKAYTSVSDNYIYNAAFAYTRYNSALVVGLPELRTFGVRASYSFR
jgi:iron complex outermembrane receptor protein